MQIRDSNESLFCVQVPGEFSLGVQNEGPEHQKR
jgi:hypothetical protein